MKTYPLLLSLLLATFLFACEEKPKMPPVAPLNIELPKDNTLEPKTAPRHHSDGSLTVSGLRDNRKQYMGKTLRVKGKVIEKYVCPEDQPKNKPCNRPHIYVGDEMGTAKRHRLLACGFEPEDYEKIEAGQTLTLSGTFGMQSRDGFTDTKGLMDVLKVVDGLPLEEDGKKK